MRGAGDRNPRRCSTLQRREFCPPSGGQNSASRGDEAALEPGGQVSRQRLAAVARRRGIGTMPANAEGVHRGGAAMKHAGDYPARRELFQQLFWATPRGGFAVAQAADGQEMHQRIAVLGAANVLFDADEIVEREVFDGPGAELLGRFFCGLAGRGMPQLQQQQNNQDNSCAG